MANTKPRVHVIVEVGALEPGEHEALLTVTSRQEPAPQSAPASAPPAPETRGIEPLASHLERARREHVLAAVRAAGGNRTAAAKALGVDIRTVFRVLGATRTS